MRPLGTDDPTRIGDYRLLGLLGAGGMGRVYLGRSAGGRTVAVKVIRPDLIGNEFRERFRREVTAARRVGGKFTAPVLDADVDSTPPWLATGYVAGFSLTDAVEQFGTFDENTLLVLAHGLAEALIAVHAAGIVHRDLKPSNVLLAVDGPKVIDFGIARAAEDSGLTTTGSVIGSPGFMCPEQVVGPTMGPEGDVFALGGVLAYAATGQGPFGSGETVQMLYRVVYEEPRLAAVPDRLRPLIAACLNKDVAARPTPQQLLDHLAGLGVPERVGWLPAPVLEEVSRRAVALLDLESGPVEAIRPDPAPTISRPVPQSNSGPHTPPHPLSRPAPDTVTWQSRNTAWQSGPPGPQANPNHQHAPYPPAQHRPGPQPAYHRPPQSAPKKRSRRTALIVATVAVGAFIIGAQLTDKSTDTAAPVRDSAVATPDAPMTTSVEQTYATSTTAAATESVIPEEFVGTWTGIARDGLGGYEIVLRLNSGEVGQQIGTSSNTGKIIGLKCGRAETLTATSANVIMLTAKLIEDSVGCNDDGSTSRVELRSDGTLSYRTSGVAGDMTGTLTRTS
ncbi:protein kinase [Nocardia sp. NPDC049707]|uniref:serine/threonine-protein kinase n=1 Tax=Nocardia sp. NPDC049707 TaxID=3154735 RepID=UPI00343E3AB6